MHHGGLYAVIKAGLKVGDETLVWKSPRTTAFKGDVGDYIPQDLWTGVGSIVPKWEFVQTAGDGTETPKLERTVVEAAKSREKQRQSRS